MAPINATQSSVPDFALKSIHRVGEPALVPPGLYQLHYTRHALIERFSRGVLELWFTIADSGPYFELELPRYYNVQLSIEQDRFLARPQSDFSLEYCALFSRRPEFDRSPIRSYKNCLVEGVVQSVTTSHRQKALPMPAQYSTIRELRRVL